MTSPPSGEGSPKGDITLKGYSIKVVTRGEGGVKNFKMELTSFMDGPICYQRSELDGPPCTKAGIWLCASKKI